MALESSSLPSNFTDSPSNKLYLYLWHAYSPVMYSLYEIDVPNPLPPPPTKDAQDYQIINPSHLAPILQLKTGEYPVNMCCVSLESKLYFMGGENDIDHPCIDEDVKIKYKNVKRDIFPRDVYIFDPTTHSLLPHCKSMNSGKSWPWAFVADEKIYVLGSNFTTDILDIFKKKDSKLKSLHWFEVYDPKDDNWTILPNPPVGNVETRWVGHAVERRKVFLKARQRGKERLYCFDLGGGQWTKGITLPSHLRNVLGRIEFVEGTFYGCYHNTIAAIAPVANEDEDEAEDEEDEEEVEEEETSEEEGEELEEEDKEEWEELGEGDELNIQQQQQQQQQQLQQQEDEMGTRFKNYHRHVVSKEMGMDAIFNVPQQLQSSSTLLHLGSRYFCYVMTGMPPHPKYGSDHAIEDDKARVISIVIFRALGETYKEEAIGLFRAKFLHSAHYAVKTLFPNEGVIHGCFSLGWVFDTAKERLCTTQFQDPVSQTPMSTLVRQAQESQQTQIEAAADLQGWLRFSYTQAMDIFQLQLQADQSRNPFGTQKLGSDVHVAAGRDHAEASARSRSIGGGEFPVPPIDVSDSGTGNSSSQRQRRRRDDGERRTLTVPVPRIGNTEIPPEDGFTWRKYGQKEILGSKYPRGYFRCTYQKFYQCPAKKFVQRLDDDPYMYEVTYQGSHTCHMSSTAPSIPPPPDQISHDIAAIGVGGGGSGSGSGSGAGPFSTQSGEEVEFPAANMADVMCNSNSSSSSLSMVFQAPEPEDVKWKPGDKKVSRRDDRQRQTVKVLSHEIANLEGPPDDGFSWTPYGQKEITGSKYPRGYYRCTHKHLKGCLAKKQLQRMDDDPNTFEVTYRGSHTCHKSSTVPSIGPLPSSEAEQISPDVTELSMDSLGSGGLTTVGRLPSVADQTLSVVTELSTDSPGRGSFMTVGSGSRL